MLETSQLMAADLLGRRVREVLDARNDPNVSDDQRERRWVKLEFALKCYAEMRTGCEAGLPTLPDDPQLMTVEDWDKDGDTLPCISRPDLESDEHVAC
jgi:hypothetical protein